MAASITLTSLSLNVAVTPSDYRLFPSMSSLEPTLNLSGEFRAYANGRTRMILRANRGEIFNVTLPELTIAEIDWLKANAGKVMCLRDDRGSKVFVGYLSVPIKQNPPDADGTKTGDVSLTLTEVTFSEVV